MHQGSIEMALQINAAELEWLEIYRQTIAEQYPGKVLRILVYGAEARACLFDDNELNVLLITQDADADLENELALLGYHLSDPPETEPSVTVWTEKEWRRRKQMRSRFQELMEKDGVWLKSTAPR